MNQLPTLMDLHFSSALDALRSYHNVRYSEEWALGVCIHVFDVFRLVSPHVQEFWIHFTVDVNITDPAFTFLAILQSKVELPSHVLEQKEKIEKVWGKILCETFVAAMNHFFNYFLQVFKVHSISAPKPA